VIMGPGFATPMSTRPTLSLRSLAVGALALVLTLPIVQTVSLFAVIISTAIRGHPPSPIAHDTLQALLDQPDNPAVWVLASTAVVIAPISEELIFRGFLQSMCLRILRSSWVAILLTSTLFALAHLGAGIPQGQEHAIAPIFVLGVAMGVAYERTSNLAVPIVMHTGFNALNVAAAVNLG